MLKTANPVALLYEQPAGTMSVVFTTLISLGILIPKSLAACCTADKHSLSAAKRWPAGHSCRIGLRI